MSDRRNEKFEERRRLVVQMVSENKGVKLMDFIPVLKLNRAGIRKVLTQLENLGLIYRSSTTNVGRYWLNKDAYLQYGTEDQERRRIKSEKERNRKAKALRNSSSSDMKFLSKRRPSGINTIFEECKHNSQILPVLQVMARRLYG